MGPLSALMGAPPPPNPPNPLYPVGTHLKGNIGRVCSEEPISADGAVVHSDEELHLHLPPDPQYLLGLTSKGILGVCVARSLYPQMGPLSALMGGSTSTHPDPLYPLGTHLKGNIGRVCSEEPISADGAVVRSDGGLHLHPPPALADCAHVRLAHPQHRPWKTIFIKIM